MSDALGYTQLGENNISDKLPEIAYNKYKLAEADEAKKQAQNADMTAQAMKFISTWDKYSPALADYQLDILGRSSKLAVDKGYTAGSYQMGVESKYAQMIGAMGNDQQKKVTESQKMLHGLQGKKGISEEMQKNQQIILSNMLH